MKILFLTSQFPFPMDNGGKIGAFNGLSTLNGHHEVFVLSFSENMDNTEGIEYFREILPNVKFETPVFHNIHIRKKLWSLGKVMLKDFLRGNPYVLEKYENKKMYRLIDSTLKNMSFDCVFVDYFNMMIYGKYIKKKYADKYKLFIFKDHNLEFDIFRQEALKNKGLIRWVLEREAKITKNLEIDAVKKSDIIFTVCHSDAKFFSSFNQHVYSMLPTFEVHDCKHELSREKRILYIGNLSWKPNLDGMKWFIENVWERILKRCPECCVDIIGSAAEENPFPNYKNVNYIGYVKDISDVYKDYRVFIVPLFEGGGIRIKILEAFNNNVAVVATSMSCETIGATSNELCIADSAETFEESVVKLLTDDKCNELLRNNAKQFLNENFSLFSRQKEFDDIIKEIE